MPRRAVFGIEQIADALDFLAEDILITETGEADEIKIAYAGMLWLQRMERLVDLFRLLFIDDIDLSAQLLHGGRLARIGKRQPPAENEEGDDKRE